MKANVRLYIYLHIRIAIDGPRLADTTGKLLIGYFVLYDVQLYLPI